MKQAYLLFYAIIMCMISIWSFRKNNNPIYRSFWVFYSISAVFCVICKVYQKTLLGSGVMQTKWYDLSDTTLKAYVLLVLCTIIAFEPLREFDCENQLEEFGKSRKMKNFFLVYSIVYLFLAAVFIFSSIDNIIRVMHVSDFGELRTSLANSENEMTAVLATSYISNICYKLCFQFKYLSVFIAFGSLKEKTNRLLSIIVLLITFFIVYITNAVVAGRGSFIIFTFVSLLIGLSFYKYLSNSAKRKCIIGGSIIVVLVMGYFLTVSISRVLAVGAGNSTSLIYGNFAFYLGHGPIEFSKITGSLTDFAYGKTIIGRMISHYFGTYYSWDAIAYKIGYPTIGPVYNTYLGYLYTDFGSIGCIVFTLIWSFFIFCIIKKRPNSISSLYIFAYYLHYYATGNFVIGRLEYVRIVTTIFIYLLIRFIEQTPELRKYFTVGIHLGNKIYCNAKKIQ